MFPDSSRNKVVANSSMTNGNSKLTFKEKMPLPNTDDMGFCSGEEYFESDVHSPTDNSEDSVEVKISPISIKNKRKLVEPRKVDALTGPLKKRMCLKVRAEAEAFSIAANSSTPFRPWSPSPCNKELTNTDSNTTSTSTAIVGPIPPFISSPVVIKREETSAFVRSEETTNNMRYSSSYFRPPSPAKFYQQSDDEPVALIKHERHDASDIRVPLHPQVSALSTAETERMILKSAEHFPALNSSHESQELKVSNYSNNDNSNTRALSTISDESTSNNSQHHRREQRNYKNMTRERRIEANARERTRVHTISAAFDTLRKSIPSYSHNQKLSKLSVLRIACSYIATLSSMMDEDDAETERCVEMVSRTIQREGKLRKKKDEDDD